MKLVNLKQDSENPQERSSIYQGGCSENLARLQENQDFKLGTSQKTLKKEKTNNRLEDCKGNNTSICEKAMKLLIVLAVSLIIASLLIVFSLAISNYLISAKKTYCATEF